MEACAKIEAQARLLLRKGAHHYPRHISARHHWWVHGREHGVVMTCEKLLLAALPVAQAAWLDNCCGHARGAEERLGVKLEEENVAAL